MTDAPERIWVAPWRDGDWSEGDWDDNEGKTLNDKPCIEYVRADRIEQLAVTNEALTAELATCEKYRDAYAECDRIGAQAVRDLEAKLKTSEEIGRAFEEDAGQLRAKLAKAEAGLLAIAKRDEQMIWGEDYEVEEAFKDMRDIALATLAEIKGEAHG